MTAQDKQESSGAQEPWRSSWTAKAADVGLRVLEMQHPYIAGMRAWMRSGYTSVRWLSCVSARCGCSLTLCRPVFAQGFIPYLWLQAVQDACTGQLLSACELVLYTLPFAAVLLSHDIPPQREVRSAREVWRLSKHAACA